MVPAGWQCSWCARQSMGHSMFSVLPLNRQNGGSIDYAAHNLIAGPETSLPGEGIDFVVAPAYPQGHEKGRD